MVGRDIVRELRKNYRSGNYGFRESREEERGEEAGWGVAGSLSQETRQRDWGLDRGLASRTISLEMKAQRMGHLGWGGNVEPL